MNAIVSICHFCELHGPSVVFCTQAFRDLLGLNVIADIETSSLENTQTVENKEQTKVVLCQIYNPDCMLCSLIYKKVGFYIPLYHF